MTAGPASTRDDARAADAYKFLVGRHLSQAAFDSVASRARRRGTTFQAELLDSGALPPETYLAAMLAEVRKLDKACRRSSVADRDRVEADRLDEAVNGLARRMPALSAAAGLHRWQSVLLCALIVALLAAAALAPRAVAHGLLLMFGLLFLPAVLLRTVAVTLLAGRDAPLPPSLAVDDDRLPSYAVLVPLYREASVLPDLVAAMNNIAYPPEKLDVVLVCERDDIETLAALGALSLPGTMRVLLVPPSHPRTKPKALNYALQTVTATYVTIFDAEDAPAPLQLRAAAAAFAAGDRRLGCLQARLNIYNWRENWLTRQFTLEYTALFDGLLPALQRFGLPIPLGGTSNHFPTHVLREVGSWDAFNVTEDADLGVRLCRFGYRIEVLRSTTWEEAPARFRPWLAQRTRWVKGWLQTYAVHMREPSRLLADLGLYRFLGLQVVAGGMIATFLLHPLLYLTMIADLITARSEPTPSQSTILTALVVVALINMTTGVLSAMGLAAAAAAGRGRSSLLWSLPWMPIYWLLVSFAAYRAIWHLALEIRRPIAWEKTPHRARRSSDRVARREIRR